MADNLTADVEAAVAALAVVQADVAAGADPNVEALKSAALTFAESQGFSAATPTEPTNVPVQEG